MNNKDMPAYPVSEYDIHTFGHKTIDETAAFVKGLTKLEAFTVAAMQGLCANPSFSLCDGGISVGHAAVCAAEAALAELEKRK